MTAAHDVDPMTADPDEPGHRQVSRRQLVRVAAVAGTVLAAGAGLVACTSNASGQSGSGPEVLGKTTDIPVGGGVVYPNQHVVVTQPTAGTFKGFSSTCTHLGCTVNKVADGLIQCPCHGSKYSVTDGSVKAGPAPKPLPAENISVKGGQVVLD
jgi:nitrite reductase/ring-hydroxylating ferredoxin subunit